MAADPSPADVEAIFTAAVEKSSPAERAAYLDEACGGDVDLRAQVESLLESHKAASGVYFDAPLFADAPTAGGLPLTEGPGTVIGRFKLLQQIGEGGFGIVYMAEQQEPVKRKVALKIIKPGMDSREVVARFESERQALALMNHPGVAKVLDAGATESGRPFFVMELVHGVPITDFCDNQQLSTRERLELFIDVCRAVQHAHQKGIIHRDLKPSNIMVTMHDDTPVVKVIDFGVSKALSQQLTEKTLFTAYGQLVGTPLYMSPEQAQMSGLDVDTRSDVYSLGILLYELLTGTTPFDKESCKKAGLDELRRMIREDEPPRPSARISTLEANSLSTVCDRRRADPRKLGQSFRGELDWIVMKALEKNRTRRYETAVGLSRDVERYLRDEPVVACPPSAAYRFSKFARRNKAAMVTAGLVAAAVLVGVAVSTWQAIRANAQRDRAVSAEQQANLERDRAVEAEEAERRQRQRAEEQSYVADMNMAHQAWEAGNVDGMVRLLKRYQSEPHEKGVRGFQWWHLWYVSQRSRNTPLVDHGTRILSIDISPDGTKLATIGYSAFLKLWDVRSQRLLEETPGQWLVAATAFSPDGKLLAYKRADGVILRDLSGGDEDRMLPCTAGTFSMAFSPDGTRLAAAGFGEVVHLWDVESGRAMGPLKGHEHLIWKVAFSPDGRTLATAGTHKVFLWDAKSGEQQHVLYNASMAQCVAFAPDGKTVATGDQRGTVRIWDPATGQPRRSFEGEVFSGICSLAYSSDGRLAAGCWDGTVVLLDANTGARLDVLKGHQQEVFVLRFFNGNGTLASASFDGTVRLWNVKAKRPADLLEGHTEPVTAVAVSADGSVVVSGGADGTIRLWDVQSGGTLATRVLHAFPVEDVAISPDGRTVASASWGGKIVFTDLALGHSTDFPTFLPNSAAFSPDSTMVAVGASGGPNLALIVWNRATLTPRRLDPGHEQMIRAVAISPNGDVLATGSWDNTIKLRDIETGEELLPTLKAHSDSVECLAFSPDGKTLASGACDNSVILWDVETGKLRRSLTGHTAPVTSLSFAPNGEILASGSNDRTIRLWYLDAAKEPEVLPENSPVPAVAFSPDGTTLVSASGRHVRLWRTVAPGEPLEVMRLADLQRRTRKIAEADPQEQRQILDDVKRHLAASAAKGLLLRDVMLAASAAWRLEEGGQSELARDALRSFAAVIASANDPRYSEWATAWDSQR